MVSALRILAIFAGVVCAAMIGFAAEPKEPPKPKVEIRWVEGVRVEGLTVDRIVGDSGDSPGYYPHAKPAMILTAKDIVEARLKKFDWLMSGVVVHHYSVTLVLTKDARERLAKSCPGKSAAHHGLRGWQSFGMVPLHHRQRCQSFGRLEGEELQSLPGQHGSSQR